MRALAAILLGIGLAGCPSAPEPQQEPAASAKPAMLPYRTCQALPQALPSIRTPERLKAREKELDLLYRDCAERLRLVVVEFDRLKGDR